MCGILAYYDQDGLGVSQIQECIKSLDFVEYRGPDSIGISLINVKSGQSKIFGGNEDSDLHERTSVINTIIANEEYHLLLGHRRLSIIDLSDDGFQPMGGENGSIICFNGEIYNFQDLNRELAKCSYDVKSNSDTESFLQIIRMKGVDGLNSLNGMWASLQWDAGKRELLISRDRFGVKPLYIFNPTREQFILTSEINQLRAFSSFQFNPHRDNVGLFLNEGRMNHDQSTLVEGVRSLTKGSSRTISFQSGIDLRDPSQDDIYYRPNYTSYKGSFDDAVEEFRSILRQSIELRLITDVPWAVAVSGGVDSSAIAYTVSKVLGEGNNFRGVSATFKGFPGDESEHIETVCEDLKVNSLQTSLPDILNSENLLTHLVHQDSPISTTSFYALWSVAEMASQNGIKVILNGQGADEVFAGYHHHFYHYLSSLIRRGQVFAYLSEVRAYAKLKGKSINQIHQILLGDLKLRAKWKLGLKHFGSSVTAKWYCARSLTESLDNDLNASCLPYYLRIDDTNMMAHSVESRHPFMDYRLIEFGQALPDEFKIKNGWQKYVIREAISEMPNSIRWRKDKKGFTTPQSKIFGLLKSHGEKAQTRMAEIGFEGDDMLSVLSLALWFDKHGFNSMDLG